MDGTIMYELIGVWVYATGTVIASLGISPFFTGINFDNTTFSTEFNQQHSPKSLSTSFGILGNTLQAIGNGIAALDATSFTSLMGSEIGASGNLAVLKSFDPAINSTEMFKLIVTGNLLQAYGSYLSAVSLTQQNDLTIAAYGYLTQTVGNSLQAFGAYKLLSNLDIEGNTYLYIGSWIQTIGAIIVAIALSMQNKK